MGSRAIFERSDPIREATMADDINEAIVRALKAIVDELRNIRTAVDRLNGQVGTTRQVLKGLRKP